MCHVGKDQFKMQNGTFHAVVQIDYFCAILCGINAGSIIIRSFKIRYTVIIKSFKISFISFAVHRTLP